MVVLVSSVAVSVLPLLRTTGGGHGTKCVTHLHQICLGLQVYQQDHRAYPEVLATTAQYDRRGNVIPFDRAGPNPDPKAPSGLFPEYARSCLLFHCPKSIDTDTSQVVRYPRSEGALRMYAYDSCDFMHYGAGRIQRHYKTRWAEPGHKRQLCSKGPPNNTVVTWCSWHENGSPSKAPVLFLDGHVDWLDAAQVETQRWRVRPREY